MVGKILSDKEFSRTTVEMIVRKAWNLQSGLDVVAVGKNAFLFKFVEKHEFNRILRDRPWSINGQLLNLIEWMKFMVIEECDFSKCPIWIQLHGLPLEAMCLTNAISIGKRIGEVVMVEDPKFNERLMRNYMRVRIIVDLMRPLTSGFWILKPNKDRTWLSIRYEKLQDFCYKCGLIGHDFRLCTQLRLMVVNNNEMPRYENWTTTGQVKTWEKSVVLISGGWGEVNSKWMRQREEGKLKKKEKSVNNDIFTIRTNTGSCENKSDSVDLEMTKGKEKAKLSDEGKGNSMRSGSIRKIEEVSESKAKVAESSGCKGIKEEIEGFSIVVHEPNIERRNEYYVELPADKEIIEKALVLYGTRGRYDIADSFSRMRLKREAEEEKEAMEKKEKKGGKSCECRTKPCYISGKKLKKNQGKVEKNG